MPEFGNNRKNSGTIFENNDTNSPLNTNNSGNNTPSNTNNDVNTPLNTNNSGNNTPKNTNNGSGTNTESGNQDDQGSGQENTGNKFMDVLNRILPSLGKIGLIVGAVLLLFQLFKNLKKDKTKEEVATVKQDKEKLKGTLKDKGNSLGDGKATDDKSGKEVADADSAKLEKQTKDGETKVVETPAKTTEKTI